MRRDAKRYRATGAAVAATWLAVLLIVGGAVLADEAESTGDEPQPGNIRQITRELAREAQDAIRKDAPLPRLEANYAQEKNLTLSQRDLMRAFSRPVDRHPVVDAYVRWQLTSFDFDYDGLSSREWMQIIEGMPAFLEAGKMDQRTKATLQRGWTGRGDPPLEAISQLQNVVDKWQAGEDRIYVLNEPNEKYREHLIEKLPTKDGMHLFGMLKDIEQRIEGGNKSVDTKVKHLVAAADLMRRDPELSGPIREALIRQAHQVSSKEKERVVSAHVNMSGETKINTKKLNLRGKSLESFINAMKGEAGDGK